MFIGGEPAPDRARTGEAQRLLIRRSGEDAGDGAKGGFTWYCGVLACLAVAAAVFGIGFVAGFASRPRPSGIPVLSVNGCGSSGEAYKDALHAYTLFGNGWCLNGDEDRIGVGGQSWITAEVRCDGSAAFCEQQCNQAPLCLGYMTQDLATCAIMVGTDTTAEDGIRSYDESSRHYCWRKTLVGTSRSDSENHCTIVSEKWPAFGELTLTFDAVGDMSKGRIPDPADASLAWDGGFTYPASVEYTHTDRERHLAGTMVFRTVPTDMPLTFTFANEGYSSVILTYK